MDESSPEDTNKFIYSLLSFLFVLGSITAQQTPAPKQTTAFSIEGATAHLGNGKVIENSLLMFANGKITFVGSAMMKIARQGIIINAKGKHIYPGFIAANASLGLVEIDAVKASDDQREIGTNNPHIRSIIAYNAESKVISIINGKIAEYNLGVLSDYSLGKTFVHKDWIIIIANQRENMSMLGVTHELIMTKDKGKTWTVNELPDPLYTKPGFLFENSFFMTYCGTGMFQKMNSK